MQITDLTPNNAHKSGITVTLRRTWQWLTLVHSDDPVRAALNRGFASVLTVMFIIAIVLAFLLFSVGEFAGSVIEIVSIPLIILMWWLNRRGLIYGATLFTLWCVIGITVATSPSSIGPESVFKNCGP